MNITTIRNAMIKRAAASGMLKVAKTTKRYTPQYTKSVPADDTYPTPTYKDPADRSKTYVVQKGDNGFEVIGKKLQVSPARLAAANPNIDSKKLIAGKTTLTVPMTDRAWIIQQYGWDPEWNPGVDAETRGRMFWGEATNNPNAENDGAIGKYQIRQPLLDDVIAADPRFKGYKLSMMKDPIKAEQVLRAGYNIRRRNWNYAPAINYGNGIDYTGHQPYGRRRFLREWNQGPNMDEYDETIEGDINNWTRRQVDADDYLNNHIYSDEATKNYKPGMTWYPTVEYTVQAGDTLSGIAKRNGVTMNDLLFENPGLDPKKPIFSGKTKLIVPVNKTTTPR